MVCRSQSKVLARTWSVNICASSFGHTCIGQPPEAISHCHRRCAYLLEQPDVQNMLVSNHKMSARHLSQALMSSLGLHVPRETARDMLLIHRRATHSLAEQDLNGIRCLCHAFMDCNPGSVLKWMVMVLFTDSMPVLVHMTQSLLPFFL